MRHHFFDANAAVRMRRLRVDSGQAPVFDSGHHAAAGDARGAIGVKLFGGDLRLLAQRSPS